MFIVDALTDLCEWGIVWCNPSERSRLMRSHAAFHERRSREAIIVRAILSKSAQVGYSGLTEREQDILQAFGAGADLPC